MNGKKLEELMMMVMEEVKLAVDEGNSPFAALLFDLSTYHVLAICHNTARSDINPIHHAEINLISEACKKLKTRDLSNYGLLSNAWSCTMCISAALKANISNFVYGAPSEDDMVPNITVFDVILKVDRKINIFTGILENKCQKQISDARRLDTP